ncbi:hypothetical protein BCR32DRAFT_295236 [Anaeromyces robustus]|uniref:Zinc finger HIT domain-containing protein 3 n=1 Tax=Anaeromyces robustus TaxID=1754192 RepID=A0A1Y1WWY6_9FUNG|nr:hypothetical protein BCR32DRAFT_295236 [Anaeromyces robustus]|eukprot:ORX78061.1 hypothetical protein BCR32DRAFT_295236 [Anaeromyces robustus]
MNNKKICQVCNENPPKYKCPKCLIPYCSLACYKKHNETPCQKKEIIPVKTEPEKKEEKKEDEDEDEYLTKVPEEKLKQLGQSKELRDLLQYEQLQTLLKEIDSSSKPEQLYDQAFQNMPLFKEFVDKSLAIIDDDVEEENN